MDPSVIVGTLPHLGVLTLENLGLPEAIPQRYHRFRIHDEQL